ncbi:MAG: hypothetical protein NTV78_00040 [Caldiserica bacterium]|nr:hypothetical protein [Caldisericota bacterium]
MFVHFSVDNIKEKSLQEALSSPFFKKIHSQGNLSIKTCYFRA